MDISLGTFIRRNCIVKVQLARRFLFEERLDSGKVPLRLERYRLVFSHQSFSPVHLSLILFRVNDKEYLVFFYVSSLCEHHFFEIAFDSCPNFHELLGADFSRKFSVNFHVTCPDGINSDYRKNFFSMSWSQENDERNCGKNSHSDNAKNVFFAKFSHNVVVYLRE